MRQHHSYVSIHRSNGVGTQAQTFRTGRGAVPRRGSRHSSEAVIVMCGWGLSSDPITQPSAQQRRTVRLYSPMAGHVVFVHIVDVLSPAVDGHDLDRDFTQVIVRPGHHGIEGDLVAVHAYLVTWPQ